MVKVRQIGGDEEDYWNREMARFEFVSPLNAFGWGLVRAVDGWEPIYLVAEKDGKFSGGIMLLKKKIPFTPFSLFYGQRGPLWNFDDRETLDKLMAKATDVVREHGAIFLRIDPNISEQFMANHEDPFIALGLRHLEQRWNLWNSPRDVARIDLSTVDNIEDFHGRLHRDTRRCIRKAAKEGVTIETATEEDDLKAFYGIFSQFTVGKGFMSRGYEYQKKLWEAYVKQDMGRLFLAKYKGEIIGGLICIKFGRSFFAMHMGTPYEYRKLQTYYAYVWEAIRWAKEEGCAWFSFRGIGSTPTQEFFKKKFLPKHVALAGYYDLPIKPLLYRLFFFCEFTALPWAFPNLMRVRKLIRKIKQAVFGGYGE